MKRERISFFNDPDPMAPIWCMYVTTMRIGLYSFFVGLPFYAPCLILMDVYKDQWSRDVTLCALLVGCGIGTVWAIIKTFRQFGYI